VPTHTSRQAGIAYEPEVEVRPEPGVELLAEAEAVLSPDPDWEVSAEIAQSLSDAPLPPLFAASARNVFAGAARLAFAEAVLAVEVQP